MAFDDLKKAISQAPILKSPKQDESFYLFNATCDLTIGYCLAPKMGEDISSHSLCKLQTSAI